MFVLGERDVQKAIRLPDILEINHRALVAIANQSAAIPTRLGLPFPHNPNLASSSSTTTFASKKTDAEDWSLIKPAALYGTRSTKEDNSTTPDHHDVSMGLKIISLRANNPAQHNLPLAPATIVLWDAETGITQAVVSGTYLTVARTSAGPALAARAFQPNAKEWVLFGAGAQATCHMEMMELALERRFSKITIVNRSRERAEALRDRILSKQEEDEKRKHQQDRNDVTVPSSIVEVVLLEDSSAIETALSTADIISTTTNTSIPLWSGAVELKSGCLVTSIGSYTPSMQEVPHAVVNRSHVVIDTPEAMDVGDLKHLGPDAYRKATHPISLAGNVLSSPEEVLANSHDYVFFKATGSAIQDVMAAEAVVEHAKTLGLGHSVDMD